MVFAWVCGILTNAPVIFVSTVVADGLCLPMFAWESPEVGQILNAWFVVSYFVVPVMIFVFCYARIVVVMRRQIRAMAAHNVQGSAQASASQIQSKHTSSIHDL